MLLSWSITENLLVKTCNWTATNVKASLKYDTTNLDIFFGYFSYIYIIFFYGNCVLKKINKKML